MNTHDFLLVLTLLPASLAYAHISHRRDIHARRRNEPAIRAARR